MRNSDYLKFVFDFVRSAAQLETIQTPQAKVILRNIAKAEREERVAHCCRVCGSALRTDIKRYPDDTRVFVVVCSNDHDGQGELRTAKPQGASIEAVTLHYYEHQGRLAHEDPSR